MVHEPAGVYLFRVNNRNTRIMCGSWLILDTIACDMRMQCPFWIFAGIFPLEKIWILMLFREILSLSCSKFVRIKPFLFVPEACLTFLEYTLEIYLLLSFYAVFTVTVQYTLHIAVVFQLFTLANMHRLGKDYPVDSMQIERKQDSHIMLKTSYAGSI